MRYKVHSLLSLSIQVSKVQIKLIGPVVNDYISEGVVQVEHEGKWGYICPSKWTHINSYVLCGQLGYPSAVKLTSYALNIQDAKPVYWLKQVTCQGWESSIVSCDHAGWDPHECEAGGVLKIKCVRREITKVSTLVCKLNEVSKQFYLKKYFFCFLCR